MKKEEIKKWFWNKFNSCYPVKHKDFKENIILIYDTNFIRQKKLCRIIGEEIKYPKKIKGQWLFYLDFKNGYLECNYKYIWSFLEKNYLLNFMDISNLIKDWLEEHEKLSVLTPNYEIYTTKRLLEEHDKLSVLSIKKEEPVKLLEEMVSQSVIPSKKVYTLMGTKIFSLK